MLIGEKIRQERTYKKLSQKQLAEKVGMSEPEMCIRDSLNNEFNLTAKKLQ